MGVSSRVFLSLLKKCAFKFPLRPCSWLRCGTNSKNKIFSKKSRIYPAKSPILSIVCYCKSILSSNFINFLLFQGKTKEFSKNRKNQPKSRQEQREMEGQEADIEEFRCGNCIGCFRSTNCDKCDNCSNKVEPCLRRICVQSGLIKVPKPAKVSSKLLFLFFLLFLDTIDLAKGLSQLSKWILKHFSIVLIKFMKHFVGKGAAKKTSKNKSKSIKKLTIKKNKVSNGFSTM